MFDVMIEIKTAVASAIEFAKSLLDPERAADIRLEEVDSSIVEGRAVWLVTLSNPPKLSDPVKVLAAALGANTSREYRVFTVVKATGEVLSMKIRLFATPQ